MIFRDDQNEKLFVRYSLASEVGLKSYVTWMIFNQYGRGPAETRIQSSKRTRTENTYNRFMEITTIRQKFLILQTRITRIRCIRNTPDDLSFG